VRRIPFTRSKKKTCRKAGFFRTRSCRLSPVQNAGVLLHSLRFIPEERMAKGRYRVLKDGESVLDRSTGKIRGLASGQIFGRLTCTSGHR